MLKKLMITTALTGVMIGAALAEGTPRPANSPPAAQSTPVPEATPAPAAKPADAAMPTEASKPADMAGKPAKFVNSQRADQFLASKFNGTDVLGPDNKKIGDISDVLFDKTGKIEAYVVSVGGFLGIGSKHVALEPSAFTVVPGDKSKNESDKLKVALGQEELKQAANFEPYKAPQTTTGMGGSPSGAPRPGPAGAPR